MEQLADFGAFRLAEPLEHGGRLGHCAGDHLVNCFVTGVRREGRTAVGNETLGVKHGDSPSRQIAVPQGKPAAACFMCPMHFWLPMPDPSSMNSSSIAAGTGREFARRVRPLPKPEETRE